MRPSRGVMNGMSVTDGARAAPSSYPANADDAGLALESSRGKLPEGIDVEERMRTIGAVREQARVNRHRALRETGRAANVV